MKTNDEKLKYLNESLNSSYENLSQIDWYYISIHQKLSEDFIREFKDEVDWDFISKYQKLSEEFIERNKDLVDWYYISLYQNLSKEFIERNKDLVNWNLISMSQKLSEEFIQRNKDLVDWDCISRYQKLSEEFIERNKDLVYWDWISTCQKLNEEFIKKHNLKISENNWNYKSKEYKLNYIKENTSYEVIDGEYIIAYKSVRSDNYSAFNFQYKYEIGETYYSHCDCNIDEENSFGLSSWMKEEALGYYDTGKLLKVQIPIESIGAIVHNNKKIRSYGLTVLEECV